MLGGRYYPMGVFTPVVDYPPSQGPVAKARRSSGSVHAPPPGCNYETASSAESRAPKRQTIRPREVYF